MGLSALPPRLRRAWTGWPTRVARVRPAAARAWLVALVLFAMSGLLALNAPWRSPDDAIDPSAPAALADGIRHGGTFYGVLGDVVRAEAMPDPAWRQPLPALPSVAGHLPDVIVLLAEAALAMLVMLAWWVRLRDLSLRPGALTAALLLLALGMAEALTLPLATQPEGWAGLLVALALARTAPGREIEPAALGLAAAVIAQAALALPAAMLGAALLRHDRRGATAWGLALAVGLAVLALHTVAAGAGNVGETSGTGLAGALAALPLASGLHYLPLGWAAPVALVAAGGWALAGRGTAGAEVAALIVIVLAATAFLGTPAWPLVVAPVLPLGLLPLVDALRTLVVAALDRRRITVTRLAR